MRRTLDLIDPERRRKSHAVKQYGRRDAHGNHRQNESVWKERLSATHPIIVGEGTSPRM